MLKYVRNNNDNYHNNQTNKLNNNLNNLNNKLTNQFNIFNQNISMNKYKYESFRIVKILG